LDPRLFVRPAQPVKVEEVAISHSFNDFNLPEPILANIRAKGFTQPTPIQDKALEPVLAGKDVLGLANTGTGKTLAFVLPILNKLLANPNQTALIMAPTRELAVQIRDEVRALSLGLPIYSCLLIGGSNIERQMMELRRRPHIYIGTPGRLKDLHERRKLDLTRSHTVVLDEMDRMLDMGFVKDITYILSLLPLDRQTLLFSATIDNRVAGIADSFMKQPIKISVKTGETAANVEQNVIKASGKIAKVEVLRDLLSQDQFRKVLIFGRTKYGVEDIYTSLVKAGFNAGSIHGNKRQNQREKTLRAFRDNSLKILVATDVAARGLDVKDITHVINFDQPASYEDYVHRIGRTGRAGKTGTAITFVD
jgi:superfamily II DNA/RNA helicase